MYNLLLLLMMMSDECVGCWRWLLMLDEGRVVMVMRGCEGLLLLYACLVTPVAIVIIVITVIIIIIVASCWKWYLLYGGCQWR